MSSLPATHAQNASNGLLSAYNANPAPSGGFAVTPNDTNDLTQFAYGFMVAGSGTVKLDMATQTGGGLTIQAQAGVIYPLVIRKVYATGTTATGIVAFTK